MTEQPHFERLDPHELGLPPDVRPPFRFEPARVWSPLVISFPHVGLAWPAPLRPKPQVDYARNADYEVQALYDTATAHGAACVLAVYSRLVVDLNRAADDISPLVVPDHPAPRPRNRPGVPSRSGGAAELRGHDRPGRGVVWTSALGDKPSSAIRILKEPLAFEQFHHRIALFHEPYHRALSVLLERRRQRFGYAILLDAHSMPGTVGVDLVLGTLGGASCADTIERSALTALTGHDGGPHLRLQLNNPYRGGEVVRRFGRPAEGLHALQLEVSRALYMDERSHTLWDAATLPPTAAQARVLRELRHRIDALVQTLAEPNPELSVRPPDALAHSSPSE